MPSGANSSAKAAVPKITNCAASTGQMNIEDAAIKLSHR
jgi:hypothetical protein